MRYHVLGPVELEVGAGPRRPASSPQRALLAALLLDRGHAVPGDRLADAVWGEDLPGDAAAALRTQVMRLRRALGPAAADLRTVPAGYLLDAAPDEVDAARFAALVDRATTSTPVEALATLDAALALWRGPAFADVDLPAVRPEAARLDELRLLARRRRASLLLALDRPADAAADLVHLLDEQPEDEEVRGLLMRARYACGQHTAALELYEQWRSVLAEERGLDPSPALRALHGEVLRHTVAAPAPPRPPARSPLRVPLLLGREQDLQAVTGLLDTTRLVTLTGPGGVGKTRLALELADLAGARHRDGVRFCDLSVVPQREAVLRAVATAVGVEERAGASLLEHLVEQLRGRDVLVVLDNCEHVVDDVADLAERLMLRAPGVRLLATSRERLGVGGEQSWEVSPLPCATSADAGVRLFVERAGAAAADVDRVVELCRHLDGLPLAIELAAAQADRWGVSGLLAALDQRLDVLGGGPRSVPRHRSLRAVIDWSYAQLPADQQRLFDRLAVFAGSFDLAAAERVAAGVHPPPVAGGVVALLDRSLLSAGHSGDGRLVLLENLRTYGWDRLRARGEEQVAREAHARWAMSTAVERTRQLAGPDEVVADAALRDVYDELRVAHAFLVEHDVGAALGLSEALHDWALWRNASEVFRWAEAAARRAGDDPRAAGAWSSAAVGACQRGDLDGARTCAAAANAADRRHPGGDEATGEIALLTGDLSTAHRCFARAHRRRVDRGETLAAVWDLGSAALALAYGGDPSARRLAAATSTLAGRDGSPTARAFAHFVDGEVTAPVDPADAGEHLRRAVALASTSGARMVVGLARVTLATLAARHDDSDAALASYEQVVAHWMSSGTWTAEWVTLRTLVDLLQRAGAAADAALLHGATTSGAAPVPPFGDDAALLAVVERRLREDLGDAEFERWSRHGAACGPEDAASLALAAIRRARSPARR